MEEIVLKTDFLNATQDSRVDMNDWFRINYDLLYGHTASADDLMGALRALRHVTCRPDYPTDTSSPGYLAKDVLVKIIDIIKDLQDSKRILSMSSFMDFSFEYLLDLLGSGPGTTHMMLWEVLLGDSHFGFKEYYQTLPKDKLLRLISAIKKEWTSSEPDLEVSYYNHKMEIGVRYLLDRNTPSDESMVEAHSAFLNLYVFNEAAFCGYDSDVIKRQGRISSAVFYRYNRNPFVGITDAEDYRRELKVFEQVICKDEFPTDQHEAKTMKYLMSYFMGGISHSLGLFPTLHLDILDFVSTVCEKKAGCRKQFETEKKHILSKTPEPLPVHAIVDTIGSYINHFNDPKDKPVIKDNSQLFESMTKRLTSFLDNLKDTTFVQVTFVNAITLNVLCKSMNKCPDHVTLFIRLLQSCLRAGEAGCVEAAYRGMREQKNMLTWKGKVDDALEIMDILTKADIKANSEKVKMDMSKNYEDFAEYFLTQCNRDQILKHMHEKLLEFCLRCLDKRDVLFFPVGEKVSSYIEFNAKKSKDLMLKLFRHLISFLLDDQFPWEGYVVRRMIITLTSKASQSIKAVKVLDQSELDSVVELLHITVQRDLVSASGNTTESVFFNIYSYAGINIISMLNDDEKLQRAHGLIKDIVGLLTHEKKAVVDVASSLVTVLANSGPKHLAPYLNTLIHIYLEDDIENLLSSIIQVYPFSPQSLTPHFQMFFELIDSGNQNITSSILIWLPEIAKHQPDLFTDENIGSLIQEMFSDSEMKQPLYLLCLDVLARKRPTRLAIHLDGLLKSNVHPQYGLHQMVTILKHIAVHSDQSDADHVMNYYEELLKRYHDDQMIVGLTLSELRGIGAAHRPLLDKRKDFIKHLGETTQFQSVKDQCAHIIDILEGRSLEALSEDIQDVKGDVEELDVRVSVNESTIREVSGEVNKQREELVEVRQDVSEQGEKLEDLQETVAETVVKVEEIDSKTLNHAPFWSRDVSRLLNPPSDRDWRLLSSRLGYAADDIRAWSQQADPSMAMLNEWYSTHRTREATFAVLTSLQEMNRMDAAAIVENAMKMAETVVEDEILEYADPPAIFLSYQWAYQAEVKLLARHLEMAGFTCWLDVGQMGGGDKLFEKIDQGIRAAKVVICCVTEKYAKSPNCKREVNLAVNLGKSMIPLLMENSTWPPPGSMGPIFSEYLFIRFFTRPGETACDDRYWAKSKFQELLMQLSYNKVLPDETRVAPEYKDWWRPVVEEVKIKKRDHSVHISSDAEKENQEKDSSSPAVFISYQWGKQKQVQKLFKRLVELGIPCWMDIYQMGGGDSLYDKIDRGVRGSQLVLSCITTKYALSANCRREVSLADALRKPIVPLLLEEIAWPPQGPMSMVFTQLLYINFSRDVSVQESWEGPRFEELLVKIGNILNQKLGNQGQNGTQSNNLEKNSKTGVLEKEQSKNRSEQFKVSTKKSKDKHMEQAKTLQSKQPESILLDQANAPVNNQSQTKPVESEQVGGSKLDQTSDKGDTKDQSGQIQKELIDEPLIDEPKEQANLEQVKTESLNNFEVKHREVAKTAPPQQPEVKVLDEANAGHPGQTIPLDAGHPGQTIPLDAGRNTDCSGKSSGENTTGGSTSERLKKEDEDKENTLTKHEMVQEEDNIETKKGRTIKLQNKGLRNSENEDISDAHTSAQPQQMNSRKSKSCVIL